MSIRTGRVNVPPSPLYVAPTVLPEGSVADGKYRVERFVGTIGTRAVYEVRRLAEEGRLALHLLQRSEEAHALGSELVLAALVRSENIVGLVDKGLLGDDEPYVVTAWSGEETLAGLLRERRRVTPRQIVSIARDILAGLADLHEAGLAHGDLSPTRICLSTTPTGTRALLADRGRFPLGPEETPPSAGTTYQAPEVAAGAAATPRSDIYSVGAILFRAVTGWLPGALNGAPPPSEPPLDPSFARIVSRALGRDAEWRYPSAVAMSEALGGWLATVDHVDGLLAAFLAGNEPVHAESPSAPEVQ